MQQKNKQQKNGQNIDIFSYTEDTIHLFDEIMSQQYSRNVDVNHLEDSLAKFYDGLIWAEKRNPLLVYQMFEMKALHRIVQNFTNYNPIVLLRGSILLLGNCQHYGLVAEQLVQYQYPHFLLINLLKSEFMQKYKQDIAEYMGNFLKCYHKLFKPEWLSKFIVQGGCFQLFQINLKYYNCPDLMARTNSLNIVLDLLHFKQVRQFIAQNEERKQFYDEYFTRIAKQFKNQLAEFGLRIAHISKQDTINYILTELEDKIALWTDFSNNFQGIQHTLQLPFLIHVVLPLVIGPMHFSQISLFSLKFSLFVTKKLIPIMKNLKILQFYIRIIYIQNKVLFQPSSLSKAMIEPFIFSKLLSHQHFEIQPEEKQCIQNVKTFYQNFFKSKDNHFILMKNSLLITLFKYGQACVNLSKQFGLHYGGQLYLRICQNLLAQLKDTHQLNTIQSILNTLILINNGKSLYTQLQNIYIEICQHIISQLRSGLTSKKDKNEQNYSYLAQTLQYDIVSMSKLQLGSEEVNDKHENIFKIVFVWELKKQQMNQNQFYFKIPDCPTEYIRYLFVKFMLLRKARIKLIEGDYQDGLIQDYYEAFATQCPYLSGDLYKASELLSQEQCLDCEILKQKIGQPAFLIKDKNFLALGKPSSQQRIQIVEGTKIKHAQLVQQPKKKKKMTLKIKQFDLSTQQLKTKSEIELKYNENILAEVNKTINSSISGNIEFIKRCLQKTFTELPSPSLL